MRFLLLAFFVLILSGCVGMNDNDATEDLWTCTTTFSEAMRWKDFQSASYYLTAEVQDQFLEQFEEDDLLHIVDSSINKLELADELDSAEAVYVMEYYRLPSNRVEKWTWTQQWVFIAEKEPTWQIENAPPELSWEK
jgi:hypothetical protein